MSVGHQQTPPENQTHGISKEHQKMVAYDLRLRGGLEIVFYEPLYCKDLMTKFLDLNKLSWHLQELEAAFLLTKDV